MARRRGPVLQVLPSYTQEDLLKETGRLLQESKQLRERVADHWQIEPEQWEKSLADSADAVRQYTRWSVTGQAMQHLTGRGTDVNNWKAAKQVRVTTDGASARTLDSARVACISTPCRRTCTCTQAMFPDSKANQPPPTTSVPTLPIGTSTNAAAPAVGQVTPMVGMYMAVIKGAKVRADVSTTSQPVGDLDDGQVIKVLETRPTGATGQFRVRFDDDALGLAGWVSSITQSTGRAVLRPIEGPLWPTPGTVCLVKADKAMVREGFAMDSRDAGYLGQGDVIEVLETRVNEQNQVRVAFALEDADHLGWVSMVASSGATLLEAVGDDWEMPQDIDGDGQVTAEEQAQWQERYAAADTDGDGRVTADEMRHFAHQAQHSHAHGTVQAHDYRGNAYED